MEYGVSFCAHFYTESQSLCVESESLHATFLVAFKEEKREEGDISVTHGLLRCESTIGAWLTAVASLWEQGEKIYDHK